jgi:7,8-dihydropterin-6-yl-methyl-4-(beta-D-ribofuranosyl)aminobenzene 5'-phosphate synthase
MGKIGALRAMGFKKRIALVVLLGGVLLMSQTGTSIGAMEKSIQAHYRLNVVFNNVAGKKGLETSWGFACLVEGPNQTILFDTGGNGRILLANMIHMGLDPEAVDAVVLSHIHADHTGGLGAFLSRNPDVTVFMPQSFPRSFQQDVRRFGAEVETVSAARQLMPGVFSTGEMGGFIKEQALIVDTSKGLVVITGCAHPNVADMAARATKHLEKAIHLLMGGFHLGGSSGPEIRAIIQRLRELGVQKVAPSHCTGENAIGRFREEWDDDFIDGGLGAVIEVPH